MYTFLNSFLLTLGTPTQSNMHFLIVSFLNLICILNDRHVQNRQQQNICTDTHRMVYVVSFFVLAYNFQEMALHSNRLFVVGWSAAISSFMNQQMQQVNDHVLTLSIN